MQNCHQYTCSHTVRLRELQAGSGFLPMLCALAGSILYILCCLDALSSEGISPPLLYLAISGKKDERRLESNQFCQLINSYETTHNAISPAYTVVIQGKRLSGRQEQYIYFFYPD